MERLDKPKVRLGRQAKKGPSLEGFCSTVLLLGLLALVLLQVVARLLSQSIVWTEELSRWVWIWMVAFGISEASRTGEHLRVELITARCSEATKNVLRLVFDLIFIAVVVELLLRSWVVTANSFGKRAVTLPLPRAVMYASFSVCGLLLLFRLVQTAWGRIRTLAQRGGQR